ncbi:MAG TPA: c-type cytochrome [Candidatus Binatia bacterium]|nr:c-type cytochrome [Candidatus Binatia bacterium]
MKRSKAGVYFMVLQGAVLLAGLFAAASTAPDEKAKGQQYDPGHLIPSLNGADIYRAHCATCHGVAGKGDGPVAPALNTKLPDLSTITQRSGGVFPVARVRKIIIGDELILGHGSREMPIWGPIFHQIQQDRDYGEVRLQNVTDYLKSIQK